MKNRPRRSLERAFRSSKLSTASDAYLSRPTAAQAFLSTSPVVCQDAFARRRHWQVNSFRNKSGSEGSVRPVVMLLRHWSDRASEVFYLEPTAEHTHTLIYLHGFSCNGFLLMRIPQRCSSRSPAFERLTRGEHSQHNAHLQSNFSMISLLTAGILVQLQ